MPTEGLSEENWALVKRVDADDPGASVGLAHCFPRTLDRLLDAARAEGPAPPGGDVLDARKNLVAKVAEYLRGTWRESCEEVAERVISMAERDLAALTKGADHG